MRQSQQDNSRQLPGVIATLTTAFELTSGHLWLLVFPVLLDLFFWLGPRLSVQGLVERSVVDWQNERALTELVDQVLTLAPQINLFTGLSLPLVGIPALMSGPIPERVPLRPAVIEIDSIWLWLGLSFLFTLVGLILTTAYLALIARVISTESGAQVTGGRFIRSLLKYSLRLLGLGLVFIVIMMLISLPLLPLAFVLSLLNGGLGLMAVAMAVILVLTYLSLAVPGIFLGERPLLGAVADSVRLVRWQIMPTVMLFLLVIVITNGMNLLWHQADNGSWLTLVSIAGHAFISTSLAMSVFVFYRDRREVMLRLAKGEAVGPRLT